MELPFDYTSLSADTRTAVVAARDDIKSREKRVAEDMIEIGRRLIEVKAALPYGQFGLWLDAEFGWSERTSYNFMRVAEVFGKVANFARLPSSALIALAAGTVPDELRDRFIELAESGQKVTYGDVRAAIEAAKADEALAPHVAGVVDVVTEQRRELINKLFADRGPDLRRKLAVYLTEDPDVAQAIRQQFVQSVRSDPELAVETHRAAMAQPEIAKRIENEFVQRAAQDSMLASRVNSAWTEFHPTPTPKHEPVSGMDYMVHSGFGSSALARYEHDRKTSLPLLLRFIDEHRPLGEEIVKDFDAITSKLERLRAVIESDEDAIRKALRPDEFDFDLDTFIDGILNGPP